MSESTRPIAQLAQALILAAGARYESDRLEPFGIFVRFDGTLAGVGIEDDGLTFEELMLQIASMVTKAQAFALVTLTPRANGDCEMAAVIEHRDGACMMTTARLFRHVDGMVDMTDERFVRTAPQLFGPGRH